LQIHKPPKTWENGRRSSPAVTIVSCSKAIHHGIPWTYLERWQRRFAQRPRSHSRAPFSAVCSGRRHPL